MVKRNGFQARKKCNLGSLVWTFLFMPTALDGATVVRSWTSSLDMTSYGGSAGDDKGKNTAGPKPSLFTSDQLSMFDRDGFLIVSGLLEHEIAELTTAGDAYVRASKKMKAYFSSIEMGMIFQAGMMANDTTTSAFRHVALDSILPRATAELMRLSADSNVRILR